MIGMPELIIILLVALVIFGPRNLPKLGRMAGEGVRGLREGLEEDDDEKETPRRQSGKSAKDDGNDDAEGNV